MDQLVELKLLEQSIYTFEFNSRLCVEVQIKTTLTDGSPATS